MGFGGGGSMFDQRAPGGMAIPDVSRNWLGGAKYGGGDNAQRAWSGNQAGGFDWQPDPIVPPSYGGSSPAPKVRGPLLPNNTPPAYGAQQAGSTAFQPGGWWHDPSKFVTNKPGWWNDYSGAGQDLNKMWATQGGQAGGAQLDNGQTVGGGGGGGYGGGGGNPLQAFIDAMNAANAANAARANNINQGMSGLRKYAGGLLDQYSNQSRDDTNTSYNNAMSQSTAALVNSGLANSTILSDQYARNARDRSSAMNRVNDQALGRRLDTEIPLAKDQFAFNERIDQNAPDPRLLAQLAQGAAAAQGPRYGAPMMIGSGDIGYDMPGVNFGMGGGYRVGSQLVKSGPPSPRTNGGVSFYNNRFATGYEPGDSFSADGSSYNPYTFTASPFTSSPIPQASPYVSGIFSPGYSPGEAGAGIQGGEDPRLTRLRTLGRMMKYRAGS
jgi:hypothetical protein